MQTAARPADEMRGDVVGVALKNDVCFSDISKNNAGEKHLFITFLKNICFDKF